MSIFVFFSQERERKTPLFIDKFTGITLRTDEDKHHRFVPKETYAAPTGCHHIKLILITGTYQHPLLPDNFNKVILYQIGFNCFHILYSLISFKDTKNIIYLYSLRPNHCHCCSNVSVRPYMYVRKRNYTIPKQQKDGNFP